MPLFSKGGPKNPQELVKGLKDALSILDTSSVGTKKADKVRNEKEMEFTAIHKHSIGK